MDKPDYPNSYKRCLEFINIVDRALDMFETTDKCEFCRSQVDSVMDVCWNGIVAESHDPVAKLLVEMAGDDRSKWGRVVVLIPTLHESTSILEFVAFCDGLEDTKDDFINQALFALAERNLI